MLRGSGLQPGSLSDVDLPVLVGGRSARPYEAQSGSYSMAQRLHNGKVILYTGSGYGTSFSTPSCRMPSSLDRTKACTFCSPEPSPRRTRSDRACERRRVLNELREQGLDREAFRKTRA
jgi:hypothetical protein